MKLKLFLLLLLSVTLPTIARAAAVTGLVVNGNTGAPLSGAVVSLRAAGLSVTTGFNGDFKIDNVASGRDYLVVTLDEFKSYGADITIGKGTLDLGKIALEPIDVAQAFNEDTDDTYFDEVLLEDEADNTQSVASLTGANDDIFYNTA